MPEFLTPTDIGNRAAQHCGAEMMDAVQGFNENSKVARQISFVYGKKRRAELEQNVWTFATRKAALRAIDSNSLLLNPAVWTSATTYFVGQVVSDSAGTLWISKIPNNLNNQPGQSSTWEPYFGPLSVSLYDSSVSYFAGELVYTDAGDGTYNTYLSLLTGNNLHPGLPNQWSAQTTYFQNDVVQEFPAYAGGTTYAAGATVVYTDGNVYTSLVSSNTGNAPPSNLGTKWVLTPTLVLSSQSVPITTPVTLPISSPVLEWARATTYSLGAFVMFNGLQYVAIAGSNTGNVPNAAGSTFWAALSGGTLYMSLIDLNGGNDPASNSYAVWSASTTYSSGQKVYSAINGLIYTSAVNSNLNNDPSQDNGTHWTTASVLAPWTTGFTQGGGNSQWMQIGGASFPTGVGLSELNIVYPLGSGPLSQPSTRNVFHLPAGFLRVAPQDPKAGAISVLGAPTGLAYNDWEFENEYIVSSETQPLVFRFVADIQDVSKMKTLFCEALAASVAIEVCEPLTNSVAKLSSISAAYERAINKAKLANAIEAGAEEPPLDDFISCRA